MKASSLALAFVLLPVLGRADDPRPDLSGIL